MRAAQIYPVEIVQPGVFPFTYSTWFYLPISKICLTYNKNMSRPSGPLETSVDYDTFCVEPNCFVVLFNYIYFHKISYPLSLYNFHLHFVICPIWQLKMCRNICHGYISVKWGQWVRLLQPQGGHRPGDDLYAITCLAHACISRFQAKKKRKVI